MSNDPLLGLDAPVPQPEKSKWTEVPKKPSGGFAQRTRYRELELYNTGASIHDAKPAVPVTPNIEVLEPPVLELPKPMPRAFLVKKPSMFQRFLDWLLL